MLSLLLLLQAASGDIVITGKRLVEAHAVCVKGGCTPLRDAQASIALAESQFRDGSYLDAKRLLASAISRNEAKAASDPKPVAALYEAYATVALHEGNQDDYRRAVARQVATLRDNLPADDPAVVTASTALGDMWLKNGNYRQAEATFRGVEQAALKANQERTAALAGMKLALLAAMTDRADAANRKIDEIEARPIARNAGMATALRVVRLRVATRGGKEEEIDQRIRELGGTGSAGPVLVWAPPYADDATSARLANASRFPFDSLANARGTSDQTRSSDFAGVQWADVGFWVRPDGRTGEIEVLRGTPSRAWLTPYLDQVGDRRYSTSNPADVGSNVEGVYKIERVSRRTQYATPTNSLIKRRVLAGGFQILDLTADASTPPPPSG